MVERKEEVELGTAVNARREPYVLGGVSISVT